MSGLMPIEMYLDICVLQLFGAVTRLPDTHHMKELARRQLSLPEHSKGWFTAATEITEKYGLLEILIQALYGHITKNSWKRQVNSRIRHAWHIKLIDICHSSSSLKFLDTTKIEWGKAHFIWPVKGDSRLRTAAAYRAKLLTGTYILQHNTAKFNPRESSPICPLCHQENEDIPHFLLRCPSTNDARIPYLTTLNMGSCSTWKIIIAQPG